MIYSPDDGFFSEYPFDIKLSRALFTSALSPKGATAEIKSFTDEASLKLHPENNATIKITHIKSLKYFMHYLLYRQYIN